MSRPFVALFVIAAAFVAALASPSLAQDAQNPPQPLMPQVSSPTESTQVVPTRRFHRHHRIPATESVPVSQEPADITLNFVNADVKDVAKTILGDYLKLNYEIASSVQGTVTIQTSQPLTRSQVLPVLEQALKLNDMALVVADGVYKIVPMSVATKQSGAVRRRSSGGPGYGVEIVPVHFVTAAEMAKLLEPLAPAEGVIHVDSARNVLVVEGTAEERQTIIDDVAMFDVDSMNGMAFALLEPQYTDAEELTRELNQVMGGFNGAASRAVRLVPIDRLNAILAIAPQGRALEQLRSWMSRLDKPGQGSDRRLFVYHVQNGRAVDLASTLGKTLLGSNSGNHSAGPDIAPPPSGQTDNANGPSSSSEANMTVSGSEMPGVNITADEVNNSLVVLATPQQFTTIRAALSELDIAPLQVFLEAAIAEVTLNDDLKFGVQYALSDAHNTVVLTNNPHATTISPEVPGFSYMYTNGASIQVILSTIASKTHVQVISSPKVLVLNNQPASLQVGDRVPIVTEQAVNTTVSTSAGAPIVNSVQYQDTGVILKVTPRVNAGGLVLMDISQEVSDVTNTTTSGIDSPTIQERKINSSVAVQDGETVALGGLIQDSKTKTRDGIPYLQDIPVLGHLFGDTENHNARTELIVLITPHVVDNVEKARGITDELRRKLPAVQAYLEQTHG